MPYHLRILHIHLSLGVEGQAQLLVYCINRGNKVRLGQTGDLKEMHAVIQGEMEVEIDHQTVILDFVLVRAKSKKKAGHVVLQLDSLKEGKVAEVELELQECIAKEASVELQFSYQKTPQLREDNTKPQEVQREEGEPKDEGELITKLKERISQLERTNSKNQLLIKQLQEKADECAFDLQEERNRVRRIEQTYRKEKESFEESCEQLKSQLVTTKAQLTEIIDVLNDRGEASILQHIEDLITR